MLLDEGERHLGISAKMPIAFLGRRGPCASGRVHAADGRSRSCPWAWCSSKMATGLAGTAPGDPAARGGGEPPISAERHCLSIEGWIPSSAAICICGRPLLSSRATASRLNSGVNSRLLLAIEHLPRPQGAYQRCPWNRGTINGPEPPLLNTAECPKSSDVGHLIYAEPGCDGRVTCARGHRLAR